MPHVRVPRLDANVGEHTTRLHFPVRVPRLSADVGEHTLDFLCATSMSHRIICIILWIQVYLTLGKTWWVER